MSVFVTIVLDGVGIGAQPDAALYGDEGSDTLGHVCSVARPHLPNLARLGLGAIRELPGIPPPAAAAADFGHMRETSAGKDSTTGHWELAGIVLDMPFPTYPTGFPQQLLSDFMRVAGVSGVLGNEVASGTEIIGRLGEEHVTTGLPIVYTSADSVFQVAAHTEVVPLERLYSMCRRAREEVCVGRHAVGRVIARPFSGRPGEFARVSHARRDFSLRPPRDPIQSTLRDASVHTVAIGKIGDLFAGVGFNEIKKTRSNKEGIEATLAALDEASLSLQPTFIWTNLVDFDQEFGHRNDVAGFSGALEEFDRALPTLEASLPRGSVLTLTADHGNDPTFPGTDHSREFVPLLVLYDGAGSSLGLRATFADHAASVGAYFNVGATVAAESFLPPSVRAGAYQTAT